MSMMKIAGKTSGNKAVAVACEDNGNIKINREWKQVFTTIINNLEVRGTTVISTANEEQCFDCSPYAFVSLRVKNSLDADIQINFYEDEWKTTSDWLKNLDGSYITLSIPKGGFYFITPEDFPFLKYCKNLKMRIQPTSSATSGSLTIKAVGKC